MHQHGCLRWFSLPFFGESLLDVSQLLWIKRGLLTMSTSRRHIKVNEWIRIAAVVWFVNASASAIVQGTAGEMRRSAVGMECRKCRFLSLYVNVAASKSRKRPIMNEPTTTNTRRESILVVPLITEMCSFLYLSRFSRYVIYSLQRHTWSAFLKRYVV
jgi:hypothetical protein